MKNFKNTAYVKRKNWMKTAINHTLGCDVHVCFNGHALRCRRTEGTLRGNYCMIVQNVSPSDKKIRLCEKYGLPVSSVEKGKSKSVTCQTRCVSGS